MSDRLIFTEDRGLVFVPEAEARALIQSGTAREATPQEQGEAQATRRSAERDQGTLATAVQSTVRTALTDAGYVRGLELLGRGGRGMSRRRAQAILEEADRSAARHPIASAGGAALGFAAQVAATRGLGRIAGASGLGTMGRTALQAPAAITPAGAGIFAREGAERAVARLLAHRVGPGMARSLPRLAGAGMEAGVYGGMSQAYGDLARDREVSAESIVGAFGIDAMLGLTLEGGILGGAALARRLRRSGSTLPDAAGFGAEAQEMMRLRIQNPDAAMARYAQLRGEHGERAARAVWDESYRLAGRPVRPPSAEATGEAYRSFLEPGATDTDLLGRAVGSLGKLTTQPAAHGTLERLLRPSTRRLVREVAAVQEGSASLARAMEELDGMLSRASAVDKPALAAAMLSDAPMDALLARKAVLLHANEARRAVADIMDGVETGIRADAALAPVAEAAFRPLDDLAAVAGRDGTTLQQLFRAADQAKRQIAEAMEAAAVREGLGNEAIPFRNALFGRLRNLLQDPGIWGPRAASFQREANEAWFNALEARSAISRQVDSLVQRYGQKADQVPTAKKLFDFLTHPERDMGFEARSTFDNYLRASHGLGEVLRRHGVDLGIEGQVGRVADHLASLEPAASAMADAQRGLLLERGFVGLGSVSGVSASAIGGGAGAILSGMGGPAAAASLGVGSVFAAAMRPVQTALLISSLEGAASRLSSRISGALGGIRRRLRTGESPERPQRLPRSVAALVREETQREEYEKRVEVLKQLESDPAELVRRIGHSTGPIQERWPGLQIEVAFVAARAVEHLEAHLPPASDMSFVGKKVRPSRAEMDDFIRRFRAIEDPISLLEDLARGRAAPASSEAVMAVYPRLHALMVSSVIQMLDTLPEAEVDYPTRVHLGTILGFPADSSMRPDFLQALQGRWAQTRQQAMAVGLGRRPARGGTSMRAAESYRGASEQIEMGLSRR